MVDNVHTTVMSRRLWSKAEDERLIALVEQFGDRRGKDSRWHEISQLLPGRTNKVSLQTAWEIMIQYSHNINRTVGSAGSTHLILLYGKVVGPKRRTNYSSRLMNDWAQLGKILVGLEPGKFQSITVRLRMLISTALLIKGRKDDQCAKRYNEILNPSAKNRLNHWSPEEDKYLAAKVNELGHKWAVIATGLPGRPALTCRNRWRRLVKDISRISDSSSNEPQSSTNPSPSSESTSTCPTTNPPHYSNSNTQNNIQGIERFPTVSSPGISENAILSPLFHSDDIDSALASTENNAQFSLEETSFFHGQREESFPKSSLLREHMDLTVPESQHSHSDNNILTDIFNSDHLPQQNTSHVTYYAWDLQSDHNLSSTVAGLNIPGVSLQGTQFDLDNLVPEVDNESSSALEEAAIRQVFPSSRKLSTFQVPDHALIGNNTSPYVQQLDVHHHHHFHYHHHHHHHYNHYNH